MQSYPVLNSITKIGVSVRF